VRFFADNDDYRKSLLRNANEPLPDGCYCKPGKCAAPVIMGRQTPCRDPQKAAHPTDNSGYSKTMREVHEEAAGMGLCDEFFSTSGIDPNERVYHTVFNCAACGGVARCTLPRDGR
jgi:hypothetical protein